MAGKTSFFRSILILLNIGVIILYLVTCLSPFANTSENWFLAFPGLVFPLIFFALVFFIILWIVLRSRWWWISLIVLLAGTQQILTVFAFNLPTKFSVDKPPHSLRILQWNVEGWRDDVQPQMFQLIQQQNPDILCIEEFRDFIMRKAYEPRIAKLVQIGYAYHYFVATEREKNDFESGIAIFSKYPMIDSAKFSFKKNDEGEHVLYTDIRVNEDTFRVFATHLQSVNFVGKDYQSLRKMKRIRETSISDSRTIVSKLKRGYVSRYKQAEIVSEKLRESPYRSFICGDFNDVPNSSTYFKIKGNFQDAFLKKGVFIGRTFRFISPTLRIDYILADTKFKVMQYQRIKVPYSDHYPVEADLQY